MKRIFSMLVLGLGGVAVLGGCPIYGDGDKAHGVGCADSNDCPYGQSCDSNHECTATTPTGCSKPADCPTGQTCASDSICRDGDCSTWGCASGYVCKVSGGAATCVSNGATDAGSPDSGFSGCTSDSACGSVGPGAKCLNGTCVAAADQCSDATQCTGGYQCVQGACTPGCSVSNPTCPTGFSCDTAKGVCTGNPSPCTSSAQCTGGNVCVAQHCVAPCGAGNSCAKGQVCVAGGCIPDQKPQFVCATEGKQDACAAGSLCLHHNCYIACDSSPDAGTQCKNADQFNICKSVTTASGTYSVCGSASNLGSECDPTVAKNCSAGLICIDGFCR